MELDNIILDKENPDIIQNYLFKNLNDSSILNEEKLQLLNE